jgi:mannosyltransferase
MNRSRVHTLAAISLLALIAFAVRGASLDAQSLWRDEVDALCYAFEFPGLIARTLAPEAGAGPGPPCACPPPPLDADAVSGERVLPRLVLTLGRMVRHNGPLYYFLLRGWVAVAGTSEYAMRFLSLAFGVLGVPLIYVLGRRLFNHQAGLLAALLVVASPYLTWYSQEVKMYTLVMALALLAIYGLRRAIEGNGLPIPSGVEGSVSRGGGLPVPSGVEGSLPMGQAWRWWAVPVVATSLAFYAHILAALLIPVQVLLYLVWWPQARRQWVGALLSLACLTLPYLPLAVWQAPLVFQVRETGFGHHSLGNMTEILLRSWSLGMGGRGWPWVAALMAALAVCGGVGFPGVKWMARSLALLDWPRVAVRMATLAVCGAVGFPRVKWTARRLALLGWLVTPLLAVWLISLRQPLFTDRYLIWTAPAFYLLVGLGLASLWRFGDRSHTARPRDLGEASASSAEPLSRRAFGRAAALLLAGVILVFDGVNLWRQASAPMKSDFRAAAAYVAERHAPGELIVFQIPHGRYTFDYYFAGGEYPWADGLYTNHRTPDGAYLSSDQQAAHRMRDMAAGYDAIWLVATEAGMWDQRGLVQAWLEANAQRVDEEHFLWVDVYRYVMRDA